MSHTTEIEYLNLMLKAKYDFEAVEAESFDGPGSAPQAHFTAIIVGGQSLMELISISDFEAISDLVARQHAEGLIDTQSDQESTEAKELTHG